MTFIQKLQFRSIIFFRSNIVAQSRDPMISTNKNTKMEALVFSKLKENFFTQWQLKCNRNFKLDQIRSM